MIRKTTIGFHTISISAKTSREIACYVLDKFKYMKGVEVRRLDLKILENPKTKCKYIRNRELSLIDRQRDIFEGFQCIRVRESQPQLNA
jgi:hypothetical protein